MPKGQPNPNFPVELRLPNEGSKLQTATTLLIDMRYSKLRIWERWTWERFTRLCNLLNVTPAELASIACIPHNQLERFEQRNRIYQANEKNRAAALVLTLLEAHSASAYTNDVVTEVFPDLGAKI